ncbi:hypothetical protein [Rhodococcus sp. JS3073]|uniref:hypothetical protein n=1 Tax=Rhodococcus sp. JS3073 TaxID=3002901 RepID=UPI0022862D4B|nr:hypothetical protein [Rhodococcus sp. JS3073]WAM19141.1 hypothetical protein OYT95_42135 [Rhodococcus sp. JS3073]
MSDLDCAELSITRRLAAEDRYISTDEVPWVDGIEINLLRADTVTASLSWDRDPLGTLFWVSTETVGQSRRSPQRGRWRYLEYDWVAAPGDFVRENPGTIHRLQIFEDTEVEFTVDGTIEFLNDDDSLNRTVDL